MRDSMSRLPVLVHATYVGPTTLVVPVSAVHPEAVKVGRVAQVEQRLSHAEEEEAEVEVGQEALGHISINGHIFGANKCLKT